MTEHPLDAAPPEDQLETAPPPEPLAVDEPVTPPSIADDTATLPPPDEPPADAPSPETWEDDENRTTLFLRALVTFLAGGFLSWTQNQTTIVQGTEWNRWIALSVVANFILPLGIVWMFFAQGLVYQDWLRDQKFNAWNYGWNFKEWRRHLKLALTMFAFMLPFLWFASRDPNTRYFYRSDATHVGYFPPINGAGALTWLLISLAIYMFCWEWFHRGFLLFGTAQGFGPIIGIILQTVVFAAAHYYKPPAEFYGSIAGGLVLGTVAWREKSFVPAFLTHALVHIAWAILVLF